MAEITGSEFAATPSTVTYTVTSVTATDAPANSLVWKIGGLSTPGTFQQLCTKDGTTLLTVADNTVMREGDAVSGTGISGGTVISEIPTTSTTRVTLNNTATTGSHTLTFTPAAPTGELLAVKVTPAATAARSASGAADTLTFTVDVVKYAGNEGTSPTFAEGTTAGSITVDVNMPDYKVKQRQ